MGYHRAHGVTGVVEEVQVGCCCWIDGTTLARTASNAKPAVHRNNS